MQLHYDVDERLPRLAWCASMEEGSGTVVVRVGGWVETHPEWFVEGAWSGTYAEGAPDEATVVAGTGARLRDGRVMFVSSTDLMAPLYSLRLDATLFVSNSMVFALAQAGDRLAPDYLYHAHDVLRFFREGPTGRDVRALPTERGYRLRVHTHGMLEVGRDVRIEPHEHPAPPAPRTLEEYVGLLQAGVDAVVRNAGDAARRRPLRPLATLSRGYDAGAVSVLARNAGCREAVTLRDERLPAASGYDDGSVIAERLGMRCTVCDARAYERLTDIELEFHAGPQASCMPWAGLEPHLPQRLVFVGHPGDRLWSLDTKVTTGRLQLPRVEYASTLSLREFRLRVGFVLFPPAYIAAVHSREIGAISRSEVLRPYSHHGYDRRPFPRYLLETAGVPRSMFGMVKLHSAGRMVGTVSTFSDAARDDLRRFEREVLRRTRLATRLGFAARRALLREGARWNRLARALPGAWGRRLELPLGSYKGTRWRWSLYYYIAYQWSADRLQARYRHGETMVGPSVRPGHQRPAPDSGTDTWGLSDEPR